MNYRTSNGMMLSRNPSSKYGYPVTVTYSTIQRARATNVAILTFAAHKMNIGDYVFVSSVGGTGYNGWVQTISVSATQITYANPGSNEGTTADVAGRVIVYRYFEHVNVNSTMSIEEVQHKFDSIAKRRPVQNLIFRFATGTYNWAGPLIIRGFKNFGYVVLEGSTFEASGSLRTTQAAILNFSGAEGLLVEDCNRVLVSKMKIATVSSSTDGYCVKMRSCRAGTVQD